MAKSLIRENIFKQLKKLFSNDVVVRNIGGKKLKVIDTYNTQAMGTLSTNYLNKQFTGLYSSMNYGYHHSLSIQSQRLMLFREYELMDQDPIINSALDLYAEEASVKDEYGKVITVKSDDKEIEGILRNLFYDILNIDFNVIHWTRNLVKYGDTMMKLDLAERLGVVGTIPLSPYAVTRLEGENANDPYDVKYKVDGPMLQGIYENYEIVHFRLLTDSNFLPYGKSMIEGARRIWKQLTLMEDAMLIHRIMRAPMKRIFKIDVGNLEPDAIDAYMEKIISSMKKVPFADESGDYNLRYNMQNITEDFYLPTRGSDDSTSIDTLSGLEYQAIEDVEYLRNKLMSALRIPKAFLGYEESLGCIVPETKIPLLNGKVKTVYELIDDYKNGIKNYVYSVDENKNIVPGEISWVGFTNYNTELLRVTLDNNEYIDCTPDHKFMLRDGTWINAENLKENDSLMPLYRKNNKLGYEMILMPATEKYKATHRIVAENFYDIKSGNVVHHIDFNKYNNYPENFDCSMNFWQHKKFHYDNQKALFDWMKINHSWNYGLTKETDKRVNRISKLLKTGNLVKNICKKCNCEFEWYKTNEYEKEFCSKSCANSYSMKLKRDKEHSNKYVTIICEICKKEFECLKIYVNRKKTCSKKCHYERNSKIFKNKCFNINWQKTHLAGERRDLSYKVNHKVLKIEKLDYKSDVCDLTINKYHNFATNAGVIIHNSKSTLSQEDIRFARTIERIQKTLIAEFTNIAMIHLFIQGYKNEDLLNFSLEMTSPSTIYEQEKLEIWKSRAELVDTLKQQKLIPRDWIYKYIYQFSQDDIDKLKQHILEDATFEYRLIQIEQQGNDPAESLQHVDDDGTVRGAGEPDNIYVAGDEISGKNNQNNQNQYDKPGQPKDKGPEYKKDSHFLGRDPLGMKSVGDANKIDKSYKPKKVNTEMKNALSKISKKYTITNNETTKNINILGENIDLLDSSSLKQLLSDE